MRAVGVDLVSVDRIAALLAHHGGRFLNRCFHAGEIAVADRPGRAAAQALAARWAAKEACIKALGPDSSGVPYRDIEVVRTASGQPELRLHGRAAAAMAARGARRALVSLSHEQDHAIATVLLQ